MTSCTLKLSVGDESHDSIEYYLYMIRGTA